MALGTYTTFIQWKGTDLCMDFNCPKCGAHSHFDGDFAYAIECGNCNAQFRMPSEIGPLLVEIKPGEEDCVLRSIDADDALEGEFSEVPPTPLLPPKF
jgi:hypothetical protein